VPLPRQLREVTFPAARRPRWLRLAALRMGGLCVFIVAVGMIPWRLTPHSARLLVLVGALAVIAGGAVFLTATTRLIARLPFGDRPQQLASALFLTLRRTGLPVLGLAFFCLWTLVYIWLWALHPREAFTGLDAAPRLAEFFYYSVSTALVSPPGDIVAHSRGVRSATMIEMLTGFALLATYLVSLTEPREEISAVEVDESDTPGDG
jgi:hypothetical protein